MSHPVCGMTRWRRLFGVKIWLASVRPIAPETLAYSMDVSGEAPVPPLWPEMKMADAFLAAPDRKPMVLA
jgi:hypothetical protein